MLLSKFIDGDKNMIYFYYFCNMMDWTLTVKLTTHYVRASS